MKKCLKDLHRRSLKDICKEFVTRTERKLMKKALEATNWNRKEAAMLLKISYKSLLNKIKAIYLFKKEIILKTKYKMVLFVV